MHCQHPLAQCQHQTWHRPAAIPAPPAKGHARLLLPEKFRKNRRSQDHHKGRHPAAIAQVARLLEQMLQRLQIRAPTLQQTLSHFRHALAATDDFRSAADGRPSVASARPGRPSAPDQRPRFVISAAFADLTDGPINEIRFQGTDILCGRIPVGLTTRIIANRSSQKRCTAAV